MTEQQRAALHRGQWIAIQPTGALVWVVRRVVAGTVQQAAPTFPDERKAQKYADKLNELGVTPC